MSGLLSYERVFTPLLLAKVDGQDASDLIRYIMRCEIDEDERKDTEVVLDFSHTNPPNVNFEGSLIEDPRLQNGAKWVIRWGYFDDMSEPLSMVVSHFEPEFEGTGNLPLRVILNSLGTRARRDSSPHNWGRVNSSDVARQIADKYNLRHDIQESNDRRSTAFVQPADKNDMRYLQELAARINFVCYVDNESLVYRENLARTNPIMELAWYYGDPTTRLLTFRPEVKEPRAQRSRAAGSDDDDGKANAEDAEVSDQPGLGTHVRSDATSRSIFNRPGSSPSACVEPTPEPEPRARRRVAQAEQHKVLEEANTGFIEAIGTPLLRRDRNVTLTGVGRQLSGVWHLSTSKHVLTDVSYLVSATVKRGASQEPGRPQDHKNPIPCQGPKGTTGQGAGTGSGSARSGHRGDATSRTFINNRAGEDAA